MENSLVITKEAVEADPYMREREMQVKDGGFTVPGNVAILYVLDPATRERQQFKRTGNRITLRNPIPRVDVVFNKLAPAPSVAAYYPL